MTQVLVNNSSLQDIADAIRNKNGLSSQYKPSEMADAILALGGEVKTASGSTVAVANNGCSWLYVSGLDFQPYAVIYNYYNKVVSRPTSSTGSIMFDSNGDAIALLINHNYLDTTFNESKATSDGFSCNIYESTAHANAGNRFYWWALGV